MAAGRLLWVTAAACRGQFLSSSDRPVAVRRGPPAWLFVEAARSLLETPLPPLHLLRTLKELRSLLLELSDLSHAEQLWGIRMLQSQLAFAFATPSSLVAPANQVDLASCLLDAVCEAAEVGWGGLRSPAAGGSPASSRHADRSAARVYELTADIADAAEAWLQERSCRPR